MIPAKDAATKCVQYLRELVGHVERPRIEEVEITDDRRYWNITISYIASDENAVNVFGGSPRMYKAFEVATADGTILKMKMHKGEEP